jgi:solute carrier family 25 carnitine/acylcarnitine transporter 20/29
MANGTIGKLPEQERAKDPAHYKGFVAGVFSGVAKLTVGHP